MLSVRCLKRHSNADFLGGTVVKNPPVNAGHVKGKVLISGSGRSPGEGNRNPLQYFYLENSADSGAWQDTAHGLAKSQIQ